MGTPLSVMLAHIVCEQRPLVKSFFAGVLLLGYPLQRGGQLNFGAWLAEQRSLAGMSQRQLAGKSALSPAYVAGLERGRSEPPPLKTCKNLARALGLDWEEAWQRSFAARLKRWLKREGYSGISTDELVDVVKRIESFRRKD